MKQRYLDSLKDAGSPIEPIKESQNTTISKVAFKNSSPLKNGTISPFKGLSNFSAISTSSSKFSSPRKAGNKDSTFSEMSDYKSAVSSPFKKESSLANADKITTFFKENTSSLNTFDCSQLSNDELKCYNFLCRITEAKIWINQIIAKTELPPLPDSPFELVSNNLLKNGVYLATIVRVLEPSKNVEVHPANCKFPYLLVENIELFLHFCYKLRIPDYFKFESVDLFEGKNLSNVIETIHCLAFHLSKSKNYPKIPPMINLSGSLKFSSQDFLNIKRKMSSMGGLKTFEFFENEQEHKSSVANKYTLEQSDDTLSGYSSAKNKSSNINIYKTPIKNKHLKELDENSLTTDSGPGLFQKHISIQPSYYTTKEQKENSDTVETESVTPDVFTTSILNQITTDIETRRSRNQNNEVPRSMQESFVSGTTLNNIDNIPKMPFDLQNESNDLSYYSRSVTSQFSSPRRRRRRARMAGLSEYDNYSVSSSNYISDAKSDASISTCVSGINTHSLNYKGESTTANNFETCVIQFQSLIRASFVRFKKFDLDSRFELFEDDVVSFQASTKGHLIRCNKKRTPVTLQNDVQDFVIFQALLKGTKIRYQNNQILFALIKNKYTIEVIRDNVKGYLVRNKVFSALSRQKLCVPYVLNLQSLTRGILIRKKFIKSSGNDITSVVLLQALLKCNNLRIKLNGINTDLKDNYTGVTNLQSAIRGQSVRFSINQVMSSVHFRYPEELNSLSGYIKGAFLRNKLYKQMYELELLESTSISLQSSIKGLLVRYCVGVVRDYVDSKETDIVVFLQASIKGHAVRKNINIMDHYYVANKEKVIIIQNRIRAYQMMTAYRDVMNSGNPELKSVSKFVHLLNGTTPVHESEDKLNNLKDVIDSTNMEISKKQKNTMILAKKLMILKDNVENVDLSDDKNGRVHKIMASLSHESANGFGKSLSYIEMMQSYEKLLYLLQNDPFYFRVLYNEDPSKTEKFIKLIFYQNNGTINKRESILIIKLITEFLHSDIERHSNLEDFLFDQDIQLPWKRQLHLFLVTTRKGFMNTILFETVNKLKDMTLMENMSFESDPLKIYQSLDSSADMSLSPQEAIEIPEVNKKYVRNMISLWSFIEEIQQIIIDNLDCLPIEILHLCTKAYHLISTKTTDEFDSLEGISKILIGGLINDYLLHGSSYEPSLKSNSKELQQNLQVLTNSLSTVFAMRKFKGYYQQLNSYVEEIGNDIASILSSLIIPPDLQNLVDNMVYKDMNMIKPPVLTINAKYLTEIQSFLEDQVELLPEVDPVIEILESLSNSELEMSGNNTFKDSAKVINLQLNPSSYVLADVTNRSKPIYNSVMWGIALLLQVIDSRYFTNILDMLIHDDSDFEEEVCERKFQKLLESNPRIMKTNMALKNGSNDNYLDLKMHVTEKLVELDRLGLIDKNSKYQGLINSITNNLKTHQYFKQKNKKEINVVNDTIKILTEKLVKSSSDYTILNDSFDKFLNNLKLNLNNSGTVKKHRLQFKSSRDKGKKQSLNSLQRTYSLKTLYEQRILTHFKGLNLNVLPVNYFGNGGVKYPHITFTISSNDGKTYILNMEKNGINTQDKITILNLLDISVTDNEIACLNDQVKFSSTKLFKLFIHDFIS